MNKNRNIILKITLGAMFAALSVIINLGFDLWLNLETFGFPFYGIPLILAGVFLGPKYAIIIAIVSDTTFGLAKGYYPWFVFSTIAWALVPSLMKARNNRFYWMFTIIITYVFATLLNTFAMLMNFSRTAAFANLWLRVGLIIPFGIVIGIISNHLFIRLKELLPKELFVKERKRMALPDYLINLKEIKVVKYQWDNKIL